MKTPLLLVAAAIAPAALVLNGQTILTNQHADIGVNYEAGAWNLHIHNETDGIEYLPPSGPSGAILQVGAAASGTVPTNSSYGFLGPSGSPVWILPNTQNPDLLFLGFGAEELAPGLFVGDTVNMALSSITGPGHFAVFDFDSFGTPVVLMNSRDGTTGADSVGLSVGAHNDLNWAFSELGTYTVNFEASGTLVAGNQFTSSGPVAYTFQVVPEPGTGLLLGAGFLGLWLSLRSREVRK